MNNLLQQFSRLIEQSHYIVFFGGAGVSTESGIPDFRSVDGLYNQQYAYPPETIISHDFFLKNPEEFFRFYKHKILAPATAASPNAAHKALAELESQGKLSAVITQNIDGLHQQAGSKNVFELHGTIHKNYCMKCGRFHSLEDIILQDGIPLCNCGGIIKPDVVLYGEPLDDTTVTGAVTAIANADLLIVGGTSLIVYPAAGFLDFYQGSKIVQINLSATSCDSQATLSIHDPIGKVFSELKKL